MRDFVDRFRELAQTLGWVDCLALSVLVIFVFRGILHGFVWQVAALIGVGGGLLAARALAADCAPVLRDWFPSLSEEGTMDLVVSYFSIFILVVIAASMLGRLLRSMIDRLHLASYDRLFGAIFGGVKACALLVIGVSFLSLFEPMEHALAASRTARISGQAIERSGPFVPPEVKVHLQEAFDSLDQVLREDEERKTLEALEEQRLLEEQLAREAAEPSHKNAFSSDPSSPWPTLEGGPGSVVPVVIDPETGQPIDPATGFLIDQETGRLIDPTTGLQIDPDASSGLSLDGAASGTQAEGEAAGGAVGEDSDQDALRRQLQDLLNNPDPAHARDGG